MSLIVNELVGLPGVIAAGEYSYRGDRFAHKGQLNDEMARMASIMCRATSLSQHMQVGILESFCPDCGLAPARGWVVHGPDFSVCNVANVFCFLDNRGARLNEVVELMKKRLADADTDLI